MIDDYKFPPDYLETEQTRKLREGLGEKLWEALEVLEMENIDKEVTEKVMGWIPNEDGDWNTKDGHWCGDYETDWHPSTSWNDVARVVEKMREKSLWLSLRQIPSKHPEWYANFSFGGMAVGNRIRGEGYALIAPLAICKAALRAVAD